MRLRAYWVTQAPSGLAITPAMITVNPRTASFIPWIGRDGQIDRGKLQAAVDYGFAIIRWHIDQAPPKGRL